MTAIVQQTGSAFDMSNQEDNYPRSKASHDCMNNNQEINSLILIGKWIMALQY